MIVDAFLFFNELDTLELRLEELSEIVDKFVIVECAKTLAGQSKPFLLAENMARFRKFEKKIILFQLEGLPPLVVDSEKSRFWLEKFQRDAIMHCLVCMNLDNMDVIMVSDVDEIPRKEVVANLPKLLQNYEIVAFKQRYFKYFFDVDPRMKADLNGWIGTVATRYQLFSGVLPHQLRRDIARAGEFFSTNVHCGDNKLYLDEAGWHLSYFGGLKALRYKTANFAHGAGNLHGDARSTPVGIVSREELTDLGQFDDALVQKIHNIMSCYENVALPSCIWRNIESYYHLFACSFTEKPVPWL